MGVGFLNFWFAFVILMHHSASHNIRLHRETFVELKTLASLAMKHYHYVRARKVQSDIEKRVIFGAPGCTGTTESLLKDQ